MFFVAALFQVGDYRDENENCLKTFANQNQEGGQERRPTAADAVSILQRVNVFVNHLNQRIGFTLNVFERVAGKHRLLDFVELIFRQADSLAGHADAQG